MRIASLYFQELYSYVPHQPVAVDSIYDMVTLKNEIYGLVSRLTQK